MLERIAHEGANSSCNLHEWFIGITTGVESTLAFPSEGEVSPRHCLTVHPCSRKSVIVSGPISK